MLEQTIVELTAAMNANTAAILGSKMADVGKQPDKAQPAEAKKTPAAKAKDDEEKTVAPKRATPASRAKAESTITQEKLRVLFEGFLAVKEEEEYDLRKSLIKAFVKDKGVERITLLPEDTYQEAADWLAETKKEREDAISGDDKSEDDGI